MTNLSDALEFLKQTKATQEAEKKKEPEPKVKQVVAKGDIVPPMYNMTSSNGKTVVKMMGEEPLKEDEQIIAE